MGLGDEIAAQQRAKDDAAAAERAKAKRVQDSKRFYAQRPWANPNDELVRDAPSDYRPLVEDVIDRMPPQFWDAGVLYEDLDGRLRIAFSTVSYWRTKGRALGQVQYTHGVKSRYDSYDSTTYTSWKYTILEDGRVGSLMPDVEGLTSAIASVILGDARPIQNG